MALGYVESFLDVRVVAHIRSEAQGTTTGLLNPKPTCLAAGFRVPV